MKKILAIAGPTASGKSARAIAEAKARGGEIISVDSRQVYRMLDIGTEKASAAEMESIPHHLIDVRDPKAVYTAGDFVKDATRLIDEIHTREKLPILAGGSLFYFDALLNGLPDVVEPNPALRIELEKLTDEELFERIVLKDPRRAADIDPKNRRRLVRALEIVDSKGGVSKRAKSEEYEVEWIVFNPPAEELRTRMDARLKTAFERGLIEEVRKVREYVGDARLNELGLEYKIVGEYLRGERDEVSLLPALSAKLHQYARHQRSWLRKLSENATIS